MNRNREVLSPETRTLLRSLHQGVDLETEIDAILRQFKTVPPESIAAASLQIRHDAALYAALPAPYWLSPPKPNAALKLLQRTPGLEFIYIFHSSGYVREASLNKITGGLQSPFLAAAVMWRMNEWVEPVRAAAVRCAHRVFPLTPPDIIARAALDLLRQQHGWGRGVSLNDP